VRIFNKYSIAAIAGAIIFVLPGCSKRKRIPEEIFQDIITESLMSDAVIRELGRYSKPGEPLFPNTLDYYKPIVEKHGYTMKDVRYTIEYMATRKSNPMKNVMENVERNIERQKQRANYLYQSKLKLDTLAINYFADTVYSNDTTLKGKIGKFNIYVPNPKEGDYTLAFDYRSIAESRGGSRTIKHRLSSLPKDSVKITTGTLWISRRNTPSIFKEKIPVRQSNYDSLNISFYEPPRYNEYKGIDTSYMSNFRVTYNPTLEKARMEYFYLMTGIGKPYNDIYEERYFGQKDSLPTPLFR